MGFYELQDPYAINEVPPERGIIIDHIFACGISLLTVSIVTHLVTTRYISQNTKSRRDILCIKREEQDHSKEGGRTQ